MASDEQSRLKSIVETAVDGIMTITERGTIDSFNPAAAKLFAYPAEEVIGRNVAMLMPATYHEQHDGYLQEYVNTSKRKVIGIGREVVGRRKDGSTFPMRLSVGEFWHEGQRMFTGIVHDLTEQKRAEHRAMQSERLAAVGKMLSVLTHESRNALQISQANLELLALGIEDDPEAMAYVARIQNAQDRLRRLFEELRDFAAPLALDVEICNLGRLANQVVKELSALHSGREIRVREIADDLDRRCTVDPFRMHQVFRNLLENSIAACPDPVAIVVKWSETELDRHPALRFSLCDNGPGISTEPPERVFQPFITTKSKGTGLGLAIAKRIIESHGGQITIGQDGNPGAEFVITLPREA